MTRLFNRKLKLWIVFLVLSNLKIGFLGAGRMSRALARSLIERNVVSSKHQIIASDVDEKQRKLVTVCYLV